MGVNVIWHLNRIPKGALKAAGGKAATLARLAQAGYPVPPGFVITAGAFDGDKLRPAAWQQVAQEAEGLRSTNGDTRFAVRSSALAEDSALASFAGEFETRLGIPAGEELCRAIHAVYRSRHSPRVAAYARSQGLDAQQEMAVLVQEMVPAELAGVLFTVDPLSGSQSHMSGSLVHGLGEQLVSGEADGESFTLTRPSGAYDGPPELQPFARTLFQLARRLEHDLDGAQDIEWAVAGNRLYLLQSRPITTVQGYDRRTGVWNDSHRGDYLWSNANFGEALPGVMTPLTWSVIQIYGEETFGNPLPGNHPLMGNIGGRFYVNLTLFASMLHALGFSRERMNRESQEFFGNLPDDVEVPTIPFSRLSLLPRLVPFAVRAALRRQRRLRHLASFTEELPAQAAHLTQAIASANSPATLLHLWQDQFEPLLRHTYQMLQAGTSHYENSYRPLHRMLAEKMGEEDANILLSGVSEGDEMLASLGPLLGLWRTQQGQMSRQAYLQQYGHRGLHEFELSQPRPAEDPHWLQRQLDTLRDVDVPAMLARRQEQKQLTWERYARRFPAEASDTERQLLKAARAARSREAIRSETTRLLGVARSFALRAGTLTGAGDDVFFLSLEELLKLLRGAELPRVQVERRRQAHEQLSQLPPYPALIRGRFDPFTWAADPRRRSDLFDAHTAADEQLPGASGATDQSAAVVRGLPASAGVVEGRVRCLQNVEEAHLLEKGEVLVAVTTNVGWTPLFPRAAAVVTDVGAPLSHAAIVARELGIPAVVGTRDASMRLQTGDYVRVDGTHGTVTRLTPVRS
jgi:pyruvate,water dikinase